MRGNVNLNGYQLTITCINVNSKLLFNTVNEFVMECLERITIFRRNNDQVQQNIYDSAHDFMSELMQEDKIENYQVICDARNNSEDFANNNGFFAITIKYRQRHCLNVTSITHNLWKQYNGQDQS